MSAEHTTRRMDAGMDRGLFSALRAAGRLPPRLGSLAGRALWQIVRAEGGPLEVAPGEVVFLWRGEGDARVAGDWTGWRPSVQLSPLGGTGIQRARVSLPADAMVGYKLVVDGAWHFDPLNPARVGAGMGLSNTLLTLRAFRGPQVLERDPPQRGQLIDLGLVVGEGLQGGRRVRVYLPPGYHEAALYPTLYVLDGDENVTRGLVPDALDRMAAGGYPRVIAVFMDHPGAERHLDYTPYFQGSRLAGFGAWLVKTVIPLIEGRYRAAPDRARRVIWGQSFGGTCALGLHHAYPQVFGRVAGQSGVYRWESGESIVGLYTSPPPPDTRFYLDSTHFSMEPTQSEAMADALMALKAHHVYWRRGTNHTYEAWRFWLPAMVGFLLGGPGEGGGG